MTNTQQTDGVLTLSEKRNILSDELAKAIAEMFDSGETEDVLHKLYEAIYKVTYSRIHSNASFLKYHLDIEPIELYSALEVIQEFVESEDRSAIIAEREHLLQEQDEKYFAGITVMEDIGLISFSNPNTWLADAQNLIAKLNEVESITAMTDFTEQCEAYADYFAKGRIKAISERLLVTGIGPGGTLESEDIQHIIKVNYLNDAFSDERERLAEIFKFDDIIEKYGSPMIIMERMVKEDNITKLLNVLENTITRKST